MKEHICGNPYVGRGIVVGMTEDGRNACGAYFKMGRSNNSRNRIFTEKNGDVFTEPFDCAKVEDPSLIIYSAIRKYKNYLILTNGNQTDTVYDGLKSGISFSDSLKTREFEPDAPNFTPRISALIEFKNNSFDYEMSILKSADAEGSACNRFTFSYSAIKGVGHFIHTYVTDGDPLPTFVGEPERVSVGSDIDEFTNTLWNALDDNNKISLCVIFTDLTTGKEQRRIINKNAR
ncbi:MAG: IMP cyclohydrolase [Clostridia bacterium]|nr:IMP cyclohydrolase [Clostridia bacterium]